MLRKSVIQVLPNLGLVGGTAAKVKLFAEHSHYQQIICYSANPKNKIYIGQWEKTPNCILEEIDSISNPFTHAYQLYKIAQKYKATIIHVYFPIASISASLVKVVFPTIKIVRSFEGAIQYSKYKSIAQKMAFKKHDVFIAISQYIKQYYENLFPELRNGRIQVVYNCSSFDIQIDKPIFHDINKKCLVSVGGLNPSKNTETLVETVRLLKQKNIFVRAFILGDGPLRDKIETMIGQYELQDRIKLCGFCKDVIPYLDECSIYVHTANNEGFGMAVVEAMSRYCAVIVSDACALPELIKDGEDGLIARTYDAKDWANKIEWLLSNQSKVNEFGIRAYKKATTIFSVQKYVTSIDNIYSNLYEDN